jgi:hypothetical protein
MTSPKGESTVTLFVIFIKLLELCGAIQNFDHHFAFVLRRIERSRLKQLPDCAVGYWVNLLFYNTLTLTEYSKVPRVHYGFNKHRRDLQSPTGLILSRPVGVRCSRRGL